jgi:hypothetical protein
MSVIVVNDEDVDQHVCNHRLWRAIPHGTIPTPRIVQVTIGRRRLGRDNAVA